MNLIIIGATGLVGQEFIKLAKNLPSTNNWNFQFIASEKSKGKTIIFKRVTYELETLDDINFSKNNTFINCSSSEIAKIIKNKMNMTSILIDNSSAFRMDSNIPLVVPHINFLNLNKKNNIISNPNCSTIILSCLLDPLKEYGFERIVVSTYQAASGAGKEGLDELELQTNQHCNNEELTTDYWNKQYVFNCFVHNSSLDSNSYNQEEMKLINETRKIFNIPDLKITATCIRVPTIRSHCESVNIQFKKPITYEEIINLLSSDHNIVVLDNKKELNFPETLSSSNKKEICVGHIRMDESLPKNHGWNFWISGDQILRGAAFNAYGILWNIMEILAIKPCL